MKPKRLFIHEPKDASCVTEQTCAAPNTLRMIDPLWRAMVISWVKNCLPKESALQITERIQNALNGMRFNDSSPRDPIPAPPPPLSPIERGQLFD